MTDTRTPTYTDRRSLQTVRIKAMHEDGTIDTEAVNPDEPGLQGWSWGGHPSLRNLEAGAVLLVETQNLSSIVGVAVPDTQQPDMESSHGWRFRKSDQVLDAEHAAWSHALNRRRQADLDQNREDWQRREDLLPEWLRVRLLTFHKTGGEAFELDGWPYELAICELAALLDEHGNELDAPEVKDLLHREGYSGNQVGFARALVGAHREHPDRSLAGTVSALSPISGDPDYSGSKAED